MSTHAIAKKGKCTIKLFKEDYTNTAFCKLQVINTSDRKCYTNT